MARQTTTNSYLAQFQAAQDQARRANELRYQQMMQIADDVIAQYQPGGSFGQGAMALYEQGKGKAMSSGMQSLVSSGLSNTTVAAGLPLAYEQEVGSPFRMQLEDMRQSRLAEAQMAKSGAIERRQDIGPDPNLLAQLMQQSAPAGGGGSGASSWADFKSRWTHQDQPSFGAPAAAPPAYITGGGKAPGYMGGSGYQTGGGYGGATTPSMPEADYQALLKQNMQANPHLPGAQSYFQKTGATSNAPNYWPKGAG